MNWNKEQSESSFKARLVCLVCNFNFPKTSLFACSNCSILVCTTCLSEVNNRCLGCNSPLIQEIRAESSCIPLNTAKNTGFKPKINVNQSFDFFNSSRKISKTNKKALGTTKNKGSGCFVQTNISEICKPLEEPLSKAKLGIWEILIKSGKKVKHDNPSREPISSYFLQENSIPELPKRKIEDTVFREGKVGQLFAVNNQIYSIPSETVKCCLRCGSSRDLLEIKAKSDLLDSVKSLLDSKECPILLLDNLKELSTAKMAPTSVALCKSCCVIVLCEPSERFKTTINRIFNVKLKKNKTSPDLFPNQIKRKIASFLEESEFIEPGNLMEDSKRRLKDREIQIIKKHLSTLSLSLRRKFSQRKKLISKAESALALLPDKLGYVVEAGNSQILLQWIQRQRHRLDSLGAEIQGKQPKKSKFEWSLKLDIQRMIEELNDLAEVS